MVFCAWLTTLIGAALVYLAHPQQRLRRIKLPTVARMGGLLALLAGAFIWCVASGTGAGVAGAMTTIMFAWVALPYLAWWQNSRASATRAHRP